jgi:hypothetical protein
VQAGVAVNGEVVPCVCTDADTGATLTELRALFELCVMVMTAGVDICVTLFKEALT